MIPKHSKKLQQEELRALFLKWIERDKESYHNLRPNLTPEEIATELANECLERILDYFVWG